ncbi:MAG TPA: sigma-54 dependent transcriptional regulator [Pirellulales bacterium]|jgi:DNA-binding NtrC family response regulator
MKRVRILVADADPVWKSRYSQIFKPLGQFDLTLAADSPSAEKLLADQSFDLLVAAVDPPQIDGVALLKKGRAADAKLPVILLAEHPTVESITAGLRLGVGDFFSRGSLETELAPAAGRLLDQRRAGTESELLRRQVERLHALNDMIGTSLAMQKVFATVEQVAQSDVDVLVLGETGTGKELVARAIHVRSRRAKEPFVPVDCGAIPDNLLESELFGYERGAFTGADSKRIGLLEFADGGTIFLDELGELPLQLQPKLLRTLQERKVRRVGGREEIEIDVRLVAATSRDLEGMIKQELFRQDLYYRINVVRIELPPLRMRGDDIGLLAEHFAYRHSREMGKPTPAISPEAYQVLRQYPWPGNVRELQNIVRRGIALSRDDVLDLDDLPDELVISSGQRDAADLGYFQLRDEHVARFERQYLADLLKRYKGDVRSAAKEAKLPRGTLYRLMKNHELDGDRFR